MWCILFVHLCIIPFIITFSLTWVWVFGAAVSARILRSPSLWRPRPTNYWKILRLSQACQETGSSLWLVSHFWKEQWHQKRRCRFCSQQLHIQLLTPPVRVGGHVLREPKGPHHLQTFKTRLYNSQDKSHDVWVFWEIYKNYEQNCRWKPTLLGFSSPWKQVWLTAAAVNQASALLWSTASYVSHSTKASPTRYYKNL